jgi:hypothetical protein
MAKEIKFIPEIIKYGSELTLFIDVNFGLCGTKYISMFEY